MKKDLMERLRAALDAERAAAVAVVEWPVEKTDAVYRDAKAETDKLLDKLADRAKQAAWFEGGERAAKAGSRVDIPPTPPGAASGLATGGVVHGAGQVVLNLDSTNFAVPDAISQVVAETALRRILRSR